MGWCLGSVDMVSLCAFSNAVQLLMKYSASMSLFLRKTWSLNEILYSQNKAHLDNYSLELFLCLQWYTTFAVYFFRDANRDVSFLFLEFHISSIYAMLILPPSGFLCPHSIFMFNFQIFWNVGRGSIRLSPPPQASHFTDEEIKTQTTCGTCLVSHIQLELEFNIAVSSK